MRVIVKALTEFQHGYHRGRLDAVTGGEYPVPQTVADELAKANLVEILGPAPEAPTGVTDSQPTEPGIDDLVGGEKAEGDPENKMAKNPKNKAK